MASNLQLPSSYGKCCTHIFSVHTETQQGQCYVPVTIGEIGVL